MKTMSRKHRATGGVNEAEEDKTRKNEARTNAPIIDDEAEERKAGGRTRTRKEGGKVHGEEVKHHAGRKPRKSGGRTGSDSMPFTSARKGESPKGRDTDTEMDDSD